MAEAPQRLKKELGLFSVYALATGTTLSAGLFLLPAIAVKEAGPAVVLAYLIAAIPLVPAVFSIVELSTAMPRAGGSYYFLDRSMGPLVGTIGGFGTWLALVLKTSFALIGMGAYIGLFFEKDIPVKALAVVLTLIFGGLNLVGARKAGTFQMILVTVLLALLAWFFTGAPEIRMSNFQGFVASGWENIFSTAGLVYISYVGVTNVASMSEEIKEPERNLVLGVFLALVTAVVIYAFGTFMMVGIIGVEEMNGHLTPMARAAEIVFGKTGTVLMVIAACCAFTSVVNAGIMSASRYPLAMSRDKLLPAWCSILSKRNIPLSGIGITVGLIIVLILLVPVEDIAELASAFQLLMFGLLCAAVIVMRESRIDSYDPGYKSPFYPWMQIFGVLSSLLLIGVMHWEPKVFSVLLVAAGAAWYFYYGSRHIDRDGAIFHVFERLGQKRCEGLDSELRGIMKEKGLRKEDPFDEIVARAYVLDLDGENSFEEITSKVVHLLDERVPDTPKHMLEGFMRGTRIGATPVSHGAALPHLRIPKMEHPEMVIVRSRDPVEIKVEDEFATEFPGDEPIHAIFFLVSPAENPGQHLRILAQVAGHVDDENFMTNWLDARDEQELKETLLRDERYLSLALVSGRPSGALIGQPLFRLDFPETCLIALIRRGDLTFVPRGNTTLAEGDRLTVLGAPEGISELVDRFRG